MYGKSNERSLLTANTDLSRWEKPPSWVCNNYDNTLCRRCLHVRSNLTLNDGKCMNVSTGMFILNATLNGCGSCYNIHNNATIFRSGAVSHNIKYLYLCMRITTFVSDEQNGIELNGLKLQDIYHDYPGKKISCLLVKINLC